MRTRKEILEARISRLEKLLTGRKSVKNEGLTNDQYDMVSKAVWDFAERFEDQEDRADALEDLVELDTKAIRMVLSIIKSRYMPASDVAASLADIKQAISDEADTILADAGAWDDDDYDEFDESKNRRCESRKLNCRRTKNESADLDDLLFSDRLSDVKQALIDGANPDAREGGRHDGLTALMCAAIYDNVAIAKLLIRAGADVNATNKDGITALDFAMANGSTRTEDAIVAAGGEVGKKNRERTSDGFGPYRARRNANGNRQTFGM